MSVAVRSIRLLSFPTMLMNLRSELLGRQRDQALRAVLCETDIAPQRLWTVLFPIYRITVQATERRADTYEDLEWLIARGVGFAGLQSVAELEAFFQLKRELVHYIVDTLTALGHFSTTADNRLVLTALGWESLRAERRYEIHQSAQILHFDAFTCHPLPRALYQARLIYPAELEEHSFSDTDLISVLFSFAPWQPDALTALLQRPDRAIFNLPDEVQHVEAQRLQRAYIALHIVEAIDQQRQRTLRVYPVADHGWKQHNRFFAELFQREPTILAPLVELERQDTDAITRRFPKYIPVRKLIIEPKGTVRALVAAEWYRPNKLWRLGGYEIAGTACVQLWNSDPTLRVEAAAVQVVEYIDKQDKPLANDAIVFRKRIAERLLVAEPTLEQLQQQAEARKLERVLEFLQAALG